MLKISKGKQTRACKLVITGTEGIGKSTLASQAPSVLFLDMEKGSSHLDVSRIEGIDTWDKLMKVPVEILADTSVCKTLVLDTADWAEQLCIIHLCHKYKVSGLESIGYGRGYTYMYEEFAALLAQLNKLIDAGINIIIIAHAKLKKQELPDEQGAFDRWEMKLTRQVAPLLKEWADACLFCNYKTLVVDIGNGTKKPQGGQRVIYTTHHNCWDAKNRFGLADELPLNFDSIKEIFLYDKPKAKETEEVGNPIPEPSPLLELKALMERDGIAEADIQLLSRDKGIYSVLTPVSEYSDEYITTIINNWDKTVSYINGKNKETAK